MKKKKIFGLVLMAALMLAALACGISFSDDGDRDADLAVQLTIQAIQAEQTANAAPRQEAPTLEAPTAQVQAQEASSSGPPTATPIPCNRPRFQSETVPDGTEKNPGEAFVKSWRIRNDGSCTWETSYKLVFSSGDRMDGPTSQNLASPVRPGETVDIAINLKAPSSNGLYTGYWKLQSDKGEQFGNYWAQIRVGPPPAAFAVTKVTYNVHPNIDMACPNTVNIKAEITSSAAGTVTYYWQLAPGGNSSTKSVTFDAPGKKIVEYNPTISATGDYEARVYIDNPNHQLWWPVSFHVNCTP